MDDGTPVRARVAPDVTADCSRASLVALNVALARAVPDYRAVFVLDEDGVDEDEDDRPVSSIFLEFPHGSGSAVGWTNAMNYDLYPNQAAVRVGSTTCSAVVAYPGLRIPMEFYTLLTYIAEGRIAYEAADRRWKPFDHPNYAPIVDKIGCWEIGYGDANNREPFLDWMNRQFSRLGVDNYGSNDDDAAATTAAAVPATNTNPSENPRRKSKGKRRR